MTSQSSPARAEHFGKLEQLKNAREVAATEQKKVHQASDALERGQALLRERQTKIQSLNSVEAALVGPDSLQPTPSPEEREARRTIEDEAAAATRMVGVLQKNLEDIRAAYQPFVAEVARLSREVEESAIGVLVEEGELALCRLQDAMAVVVAADKNVRSIHVTLVGLRRLREAESLKINMKWLEPPSVNTAPCLAFLEDLKSNADAELPQ